jgi:hypothetical protein
MNIDRRTFAGLTLAALASPARAAAGDKIIPLNLDSGVPTIPVTMNGKGPYPFVMATGQLYAVIRQSLAQELELPSHAAPPVGIYTVRGRVALALYQAKLFNLGGVWPIRDVQMMGRPLPDNLGGVFPFLSIQMSSFDFDARQMRVHGSRAAPPEGAVKHAILQREGIRAIREEPKIRVLYGGKTLRLLVNTGAAGALTLYPDAVKRLGLWDRYPTAPASSDEDIDGRSTTSRDVVGDPLELGGYVFDQPRVRMMSPDTARDDWIDYDGVIGMELLRRFRVTFDPVKQNVWFAPNAHAGEPFEI